MADCTSRACAGPCPASTTVLPPSSATTATQGMTAAGSGSPGQIQTRPDSRLRRAVIPTFRQEPLTAEGFTLGDDAWRRGRNDVVRLRAAPVRLASPCGVARLRDLTATRSE
ncbi:hypothetical protein GCM10019016_098670 [Streptomyces prasinosporus]|uniref:Uncharacterized protein n=1 Tax=Streptomyces prasinosporus TaxID=68256 RepID=A0ABP6U4Y0_9ACTN